MGRREWGLRLSLGTKRQYSNDGPKKSLTQTKTKKKGREKYSGAGGGRRRVRKQEGIHLRRHHQISERKEKINFSE